MTLGGYLVSESFVELVLLTLRCATASRTVNPSLIWALVFQLFVGDYRLSSTLSATHCGGLQSGLCALDNEITLKLGKRTEQMEDQCAAGSGCVCPYTPSVRDLKPTLRPPRAVTVSTRCFMDRPRKSSFQTTGVLPLRRKAKASFRPGRSALTPEMTSLNMVSQPADLSASTCGSSFWSVVEPLAYPIKVMKISLSVFLSINQLVRILVVRQYWRT